MIQTYPPHRPKLGDLIQHRSYGPCLIIRVECGLYYTCDLVDESGFMFQMNQPSEFVRNTGLQYNYSSFAQAKADYQNGLFTPYFQAK